MMGIYQFVMRSFVQLKEDFRFRSCVGLVLFPFAVVLKDQPYGVAQWWGVLGRVKPLRLLTLPCQMTNPDGVI